MGKTFMDVYREVKKIPKGKVATYGAIAKNLGLDPRVVGWALHHNPDPQNIPCHRVVRKDGFLALGYVFGGRNGQRKRLLAEGVEFASRYKILLIPGSSRGLC